MRGSDTGDEAGLCVCVSEREMDRESGLYNNIQRKVEQQTYQGR